MQEENLANMDKSEARIKKLRALVEEDGGPAEFARKRSRPDADKPIDPTFISQILNGHRSFGEKAAANMERRAGLPPRYFDDHIAESNVILAKIGDRRIPLIDYVQAGKWTEVVNSNQLSNATDWILTDLDLSDNAFALEIKGESMLPRFKEGDRIIVDPTVYPLPGDFVVAKNGEHEATFKKYRPRGISEQGTQVFELVPLNEDFATLRSDICQITIIGTMVEHRSYRKK